MPRLSAFINGNYTGNSETFTFTECRSEMVWRLSFWVQLQVPLFSSLMRRASSQKAKIAVTRQTT